jgi:hypothetical protein
MRTMPGSTSFLIESIVSHLIDYFSMIGAFDGTQYLWSLVSPERRRSSILCFRRLVAGDSRVVSATSGSRYSASSVVGSDPMTELGNQASVARILLTRPSVWPHNLI